MSVAGKREEEVKGPSNQTLGFSPKAIIHHRRTNRPCYFDEGAGIIPGDERLIVTPAERKEKC